MAVKTMCKHELEKFNNSKWGIMIMARLNANIASECLD